MNCPHCGVELTRSEVARLMRAIPSEARSEAARKNGRKGGRPMKTEAANVFTAKYVIYAEGKDPQFRHTKKAAEVVCKRDKGRMFLWDTNKQEPAP